MVFFHFIQILIETSAFDLVLHCLLMSHKKDARLIWVNEAQVERTSSNKAYISLVDMITNTKFSNCPNVFKSGVVQQ